jgi:hypothetical protein
MEQSKIKSLLVLFVCGLWLLSITAPPILQLLDENSQSISYTLNEEESKEQETTDKGEEIILSGYTGTMDFLLCQIAVNAGWNSSFTASSFCGEIQLPPPEVLS